MSEASPSATVMLLRDSDAGLQSLLLRRNSSLAIGAGAWVFPGGRVDRIDYEPVDAEHQDAPFLAAQNAAVRETQEETGLIIDPAGLVPFAHWTTPPGRQRRFATWFFIASAPDADIQVDGSEIVEHRWMQPHEALQAQREGRLTLMPPTFVSLTLLREFSDCAAALAGFAERQVQHFNPRILKTDNGQVILYDDDAGYAASDPSAAGHRHRITIEGLDWVYECSQRQE